MTEKERNLPYGVVALILPDNILDQFDIVKLEDEDIDRHDGSYQPFKHNVHIYLEEQDNRTAEQRATLKPNGFTEYTSVKDYPVRNRLLTLHIRRRRYLDADDKSVILSEFPIKADGTSISPEFADFGALKHFRSVATKYGVSEQWTGRVEATIISHMKAWGEWEGSGM